ncbi:MAG: pyridoxine kinase [Eubacteriaceae bacterium]|jgi:pyridoxine kinase|nr:pyridoxine kinase [Eubacteriaceae bacterium]MDK2904150.1 pyridoxine kinase [Eubacteriaceae bacterium]MDK2936531.1 pyridoxine kinase [Eubacteriaceae bacterium]MDN5307169.1 pyridoxine kinase [Eubacteriaceae bacterium]
MKQKRIAAIHDISCVGRCSLTVALPILSAAGIDTGILPTAVLSTHTGGFENFTYRDLTEDITPIASHWKSLDLKFDALYSGFLGSYEQIDLVSNLFELFKDQDTLILVDPVMADNGEFYSVYSPEMAKGMARLCQKADIIVPNLTEAAFMLDEPYCGEDYDENYVKELLKRLSDLGARKIVLTGISYEPDRLGAASFDSKTGDYSYVHNEKISDHFHGTGDVFGSTLLAALLNGFDLNDAAQIAVDYTREAIIKTLLYDQERRYGVCFEKAIPFLLKQLKLAE